LRSLCASDTELKYLAQKYFVSYVRSVFLQKNKSVFQVDELPATKFAEALGLPTAPKIKFAGSKVKGGGSTPALAAKAVDVGKAAGALSVGTDDSESESDGDDDDDDDDDDVDGTGPEPDSGSDVDVSGDESENGAEAAEADGGEAAAADDDDDGKIKPARGRRHFDTLRLRKNTGVLAPHRLAMRAAADEEGVDDFLVKSGSQRHIALDEDAVDGDDDDAPLPESRSKTKERKRAKTVAAVRKQQGKSKSQHLKFADDGSFVDDKTRLVGVDTSDLPKIKAALAEDRHNLKEAAMALEKEDILDRQHDRQRLRAKKLDRKRKRNNRERGEEQEGGFGEERAQMAVLGGADDGDSDHGDGDGGVDGGDDDGFDANLATEEDLAKRLLGF
jgi:ATP-dependent RNA helicase DDX10/DBP4